MLLSKCMWVCGVGEVHHNVVEQVYAGMCVCVVQANV